MWFWTMIICFILGGLVPAVYDVSKALREQHQCEKK